MDWNGIDRIWFLTWTTYGTWLPGDERGFVSPKFDGDAPERRNNEPGRPYDEGRPDLRRIAENKLAGEAVRLTHAQAEVIRHQFAETARYRGWQLLAGAIMTNHVHLVVGVPGDPDPSSLLRDFKSYSSRALNLRDRVSVRPRWWTEQGSKRKIADWDTLETVLRYVREQKYALEVWDAVNRSDAASGGRQPPVPDTAASSGRQPHVADSAASGGRQPPVPDSPARSTWTTVDCRQGADAPRSPRTADCRPGTADCRQGADAPRSPGTALPEHTLNSDRS
jgi:REP element-mobilizing transposase RayT